MGKKYVQEELLGEESGWKVYGWTVCARRVSGWRVSWEKSVQEEFLGEESLGEKYMDEKSPKPAARLGEVIFANKVSLGGLGGERPERIKNHEIRW